MGNTMDYVVGHPRSGTAFLAHFLNAASPYVCAHEGLVGLAFRSIFTCTDFYEGRCSEGEIQELLREYDSAPFRIDSNWKLTWILGPLLAKSPEGRFVHLTRDPRENVRACFNLDYYGTAVAALTPDALEPYLPPDASRDRLQLVLGEYQAWYATMPQIRRDDWATLSKFERNCLFWSETHARILDGVAGRGGYMHLRLEDKSPRTMRATLDFFGLPQPSEDQLNRAMESMQNTMSFEKLLSGHLNLEQLPPYAEWDRQKKDTLRDLCGEVAAKLGYSL